MQRVIWRNVKAQREAEDAWLRQIYRTPLRDEFQGKAGITVTINRYGYVSPRSFADTLALAEGLRDRGLVTLTTLGTATFEVTTTANEQTQEDRPQQQAGISGAGLGA